MIKSHGSVDVLEYREVDEPICTPDKIKINIKASSINHLDIWVRKGLQGINVPLPIILGSDASGIVTEIGGNVKSVKIGDKVIIQPGTYSKSCKYVKNKQENFSKTYGILGETESGLQCEYVALNPENVYPMSSNLSFEESASMQLVFMTAYQMLVKRAFLKKNETVLILGGTSGIGSAAIQIAKDIGSKIVTTVGEESKFEYVLNLGADYVFNHYDDDWCHNIKELLGNNKVDVIFEHVGLKTWGISMKLLGRGGRIVTCGATTGHKVNIDLRHLFSKQQAILGSSMSDIDTFIAVQEKIKKNIYVPFIDKIYPLSEIKKAHLRVENAQHKGKVVLSI